MYGTLDEYPVPRERAVRGGGNRTKTGAPAKRLWIGLPNLQSDRESSGGGRFEVVRMRSVALLCRWQAIWRKNRPTATRGTLALFTSVLRSVGRGGSLAP